MNKIKQEKGITLIYLVTVIIILIVLTGVAITLGSNDIDSTLDSKLKGELEMVQQAVLQQYAKYKTTLDKECLIGTDYTSNITTFINQNYNDINLLYTVTDNTEEYKKYYVLSPSDLKKIGIQKSNYSYIVNYYTGEVLNFNIYSTSSGSPLYVKGMSSANVKESY